MSESRLTVHPGHVLHHLSQQEAEHANQNTTGSQEDTFAGQQQQEQEKHDSEVVKKSSPSERTTEVDKNALQWQDIETAVGQIKTEVEESEEPSTEACSSNTQPLQIKRKEPRLDIDSQEDSAVKGDEGTVSDSVHRRLSPSDSDNKNEVVITQEDNRLSNIVMKSAQSTLVEEPPGKEDESSQVPHKDRKTGENCMSQSVEKGTAQFSNQPLHDMAVAQSENSAIVVREVTASLAHRPTTLMITSNSNESSDDTECTTNDPTRDGGEYDTADSLDLKQEGNTAVKGMQQHMAAAEGTKVQGEHHPGIEGGALPRPERPSRPAPRTTTLVKVKVEKRPTGSHKGSHEHQVVVRAPSVEEEVRGLMQEVKEATSQIKQEVKELRQADTPTPDTPTPLREFKEFLNREEEQEQERLPTITEICRESEEDTAPPNMGGTHEVSRQLEQQQRPPAHPPHDQASSGLPPTDTRACSDVLGQGSGGKSPVKGSSEGQK